MIDEARVVDELDTRVTIQVFGNSQSIGARCSMLHRSVFDPSRVRGPLAAAFANSLQTMGIATTPLVAYAMLGADKSLARKCSAIASIRATNAPRVTRIVSI